MTTLHFDARHKVTLFHAQGAHTPLPYHTGQGLSAVFLLQRHLPSEEIRHDVAADARWFALLYPEGSNDKYDPPTGTMLVELTDITSGALSSPLRWAVDHEDTLLAVATSSDDTPQLDLLRLNKPVYVRVHLRIERVEQVQIPPPTPATEWYAKLVPLGETTGQLIRAEVHIEHT